MDFENLIDGVKGDDRRDMLENISYIVLVLAAVLTVVGLGIGTVVPGIPVLIAMVGSFFALVGIVLYILSEIIRTLGG